MCYAKDRTPPTPTKGEGAARCESCLQTNQAALMAAGCHASDESTYCKESYPQVGFRRIVASQAPLSQLIAEPLTHLAPTFLKPRRDRTTPVGLHRVCGAPRLEHWRDERLRPAAR